MSDLKVRPPVTENA